MKPLKRTYNYSPAIERRLLATFYSASPAERVEGIGWYQRVLDISEEYSHAYCISVEQAAGVIAALSPGLDWDLNLQHAEELIKAWSLNREIPTVGVYGRKNRDK